MDANFRRVVPPHGSELTNSGYMTVPWTLDSKKPGYQNRARHFIHWRDRRGSNARPSAWKADSRAR
ncbi:protein of unknown function [Paraburkholderia kururiensis]